LEADLLKLHHIGIATANIEEAVKRHKEVYGLEQVTEIVDDPLHKVSVVLLSAGGEVFIELVSPLKEDSPVSNLLKKGITLYHICYLVKDLDETLKEVKGNSIIISKPAPAKLYDGRRIAFVYTQDKYVVEFLEEEKRDAQC